MQQRAKLLEFAEQLAQRDLCWAERVAIGAQLLMLFGVFQEHPPPQENPEIDTAIPTTAHAYLKQISI